MSFVDKGGIQEYKGNFFWKLGGAGNVFQANSIKTKSYQ
jgi:hypothetical protein